MTGLLLWEASILLLDYDALTFMCKQIFKKSYEILRESLSISYIPNKNRF